MIVELVQDDNQISAYAIEDGETVGYIVSKIYEEGATPRITSMLVQEPYRNRGIGTALVDAITAVSPEFKTTAIAPGGESFVDGYLSSHPEYSLEILSQSGE